MTKTISLSLPEDLAEWLEEKAKEKGMKMQDVVREILRKYKMLEENKIDKLLEAYDSVVEAIKKLEEVIEKK